MLRSAIGDLADIPRNVSRETQGGVVELWGMVFENCFPIVAEELVFHVKLENRSLFRSWEKSPTPTGRRSERTCYLAWSSLLTETSHVWGRWISFSGGVIEWVVVFHVKHGGMAELWGRQFEKYHFSPTRYRGVGVSRGTWVRDVFRLGRCVYGSWAVSFFLVLWWCGGFTWNMGNACKGILLRLQSCFLVFESFSMKLIQRPQTWLVSVSKERQAR